VSETVLREDIALLREQEARLKQRLGALEDERRKRELELEIHVLEDVVAQRVTDDWE
jgi:ubiquinone biosynthesis protein UbiJ